MQLDDRKVSSNPERYARQGRRGKSAELGSVLPYVAAAYRATPHGVTGFSPNYLLFARENRGPLDLMYEPPRNPADERENYAGYVTQLAERFRDAYAIVRQKLRKAAERRKRKYDLRVRPAVFKKKDRVYYWSPRRFAGRTPKWQRNFSGPFRVLEQCGPVNYLIQKFSRAKPFRVHVDKLRPYYGDDPKTAEGPNAPSKQAVTPSRTTKRPILKEIAVPAVSTIDAIGAPATETSQRPRRNIQRPARFRTDL